MTDDQTTRLQVQARQVGGSRAARRLRREGQVPGVVYGGEGEPEAFQVDQRELRLALAHGGAVIELSVGGDGGTPVVVKDEQRDPITGRLEHIDLLRVRLDRPIHATTILELDGVEDAPGVKEGGILEQVTRELNVEALPTAIPDAIHHDVSGMEMNETLTLSVVTAPQGVTLLDDPEETVIATITPPRVEEEPQIEEETALVGEDDGDDAAATPAEGEGPSADGGDGGEGE